MITRQIESISQNHFKRNSLKNPRETKDVSSGNTGAMFDKMLKEEEQKLDEKEVVTGLQCRTFVDGKEVREIDEQFKRDMTRWMANAFSCSVKFNNDKSGRNTCGTEGKVQ